MKDRIKLATIALRISSVVYVVIAVALGVFLIASPPTEKNQMPKVFAYLMVGAPLLFAVVVEYISWGIRQRKFWGWVGGLCIFGLYLPSLFLPLGVIGLWGLLSTGSKQAFGIGVSQKAVGT